MTIDLKRMAVLAIVSALASPASPAMPPQDRAPATATPLDLPTALRLGADQPLLRAATREVFASEALATQAGLLPNPEIGYLREGQEIGARSTTIQISQPVELGGKRQARIALAQGAVELAKSELATRRVDARATVIASYYEVAVGQQKLVVARELTELARRTVDIASKRVAAGKVSPIDETKARLAAADATAALHQATAQLAIARTKLGALLGQAAHTMVLAAVSTVLPDIGPLDSLLPLANTAAPLQRARNQVLAQQAQARLELAARMPDLTITVGTKRDEQASHRQAVFGVSMPLPLFSRNDGPLQAALQRTDKARDELAAAQVNAATGLAAAFIRYDTARQEAALLQGEVLAHAHAAYTLTLKGFEYGKFPFLDVLDAQRTWFQAQSRHLDSTLDAWRAYADIERLTGSIESDH